MPFVLLVVSSLLDTVRNSVLHLEPMKGLPVRSGENIGLSLPLVELTEHCGIAVECGEATAVFEDRLRQQVRIKAARTRKIHTLGATERVEEVVNASVGI